MIGSIILGSFIGCCLALSVSKINEGRKRYKQAVTEDLKEQRRYLTLALARGGHEADMYKNNCAFQQRRLGWWWRTMSEEEFNADLKNRHWVLDDEEYEAVLAHLKGLK